MFYNSLTCILRARGSEAARGRGEGTDAPLIEDDGQEQQPLQHQADVMDGNAQPIPEIRVIDVFRKSRVIRKTRGKKEVNLYSSVSQRYE